MPLSRTLPLLLLLAAAGLLGTACDGSGGGPVDPPVEPPTLPPLPAGVHALAGIAETLPHTDLEPLRGIVGGARLVALGESTHTTRGYYQAKFRLIRYLVEEMGFRVLAFETPWLEALPATRYVATCEGTPEAAMRDFFPVWHDATVRDLLRWLCEYNRRNPTDPVHFFGIDIQEPWRSAPALRDFVARAAPADSARVTPLFRCLGASHSSMQWFATEEYRAHAAGHRNTAAHEACVAGIDEMEGWIAAAAGPLTAASSTVEVEEARLALVALRAWQLALWHPEPLGYQVRDFGMAELTRRLPALHAPGQKTILWAWNWHIAKRYEEVRGWNDDPAASVPRHTARSMGSYLHEALGADYAAIGLIGHRVGVSFGTAPPVTTHPLAVEYRLSRLARDQLLVSLRQPVGDTLLVPGRTYQVSQEWADPYRQFDALLFLRDAPAMTPITP